MSFHFGVRGALPTMIFQHNIPDPATQRQSPQCSGILSQKSAQYLKGWMSHQLVERADVPSLSSGYEGGYGAYNMDHLHDSLVNTQYPPMAYQPMFDTLHQVYVTSILSHHLNRFFKQQQQQQVHLTLAPTSTTHFSTVPRSFDVIDADLHQKKFSSESSAKRHQNGVGAQRTACPKWSAPFLV
ncbi:hypothetical protein Clacol_003493 [Clathrus columnatus]|uniref:Uncharacterized protein n=1 Tax=Clathrus columnatus TaxID=1419009 RepID=A0AAV5A3P2_9AGAM|nr:hypothetical protein Clacol_003493 [Clathrus columnatus]